MNDLQGPMQAALAKLPAIPVKTASKREQYWNWLKLHPNKTAKEVQCAFKHDSFDSVDSQLRQMTKRGLLVTDAGDRFGVQVRVYRTVGEKFEPGELFGGHVGTGRKAKKAVEKPAFPATKESVSNVEQYWSYLHVNPGLTAKQLSKVFKDKWIHQVLTTMAGRGQLTAKKVIRNGRMQNAYYTAHDSYPTANTAVAKLAEKEISKAEPAKAILQPVQEVQEVQLSPRKLKLDLDLDSFTVGELKSLRARIDAILK